MSDTEAKQTFTGRVYEIVNDVDDEIYIGSTKDRLSRRMYKHRGKAVEGQPSKIYTKMSELGVDAFRIVLIEEVECASKDELRRCEQKHIRERKPELNTRCAHVDDERIEEVRKYNAAYGATYKSTHSARLKDDNQEYYKENAERIKARTQTHRQTHALQTREYQTTIRARYIAEKAFYCELCDHAFDSNSNLQRHFTSKTHQRNTQE
jgi:predicted GIY-YIG superfamily endonuclease